MNPISQQKRVADLVSLASRRAIVTGAARGIGFAIACRLAEAGATVLVADINQLAAEEACSRCPELGGNLIPAQCDIGSERDVRRMIDFATARMGGIDILVNNAGIYPRKPLLEISAADFDRVTAVNLRGTFLCSREASRQMVKQGTGGCIINISSVDAVHPTQTGMTAYDASKGALIALTRSLALELAPHDIRVNAILPGGILTEGALSQTGSPSSTEGKAQLKAFLARAPLGRMGRPDDVAGAALYLASGLADYVTGTLITVDGGYLIS